MKKILALFLVTAPLLFTSCQLTNLDRGAVVAEAKTYGSLAEIASRRLAPQLGDDAGLILDLAAALDLIGDEGRLNTDQVTVVFSHLSQDVTSQEAMLLIEDVANVYDIVYNLVFPGGVVPEPESPAWRNIKIYFQEFAEGLRRGHDSGR